MTNPRTLAEYALAYAAIGLAVFPLHWAIERDGVLGCSCGDVECRSRAKHPLTMAGVKDASTDADAIAAWWQQWPDANIGLALGGLVVVDVDPRNGGDVTLESVEAERGKLPDTWLALTGGGGNHYVYRATAGATYPGKLGKGLDLKRGDGAYIVVEPSRHISGIAYAWEASSSPLDGAAIATAPDWLAEKAVTSSATAMSARVGGGFIAPRQVIELRSALAHVDPDDRDTWVKVGMALHSTAAPNAFGLWTEWSQLSEKYNPADQRRVWNSFSNKPNGLHVEAIFAMAQQAGWVNPASAPAQQFSDDVSRAIAAANQQASIVIVEPDAPPASTPIPVPVLEEAVRWIESTYATTHPDATRQAVLALASLGASRIYVGERGEPCHLYLGLVGEAVHYVGYARDALTQIVAAAGMRRMLRGSRINAPSAVYGALSKSPAFLHVANDFGQLLQFAKRQPSGVLDHAMTLLAEAWDAKALYIDSPAEAGLKSATDDQLVVYNPAVTLLMVSTFDQIGALLQKSETQRGLLAHQMAVIVDAAGAVERAPQVTAVPESLIRALQQLRRLTAQRGDFSQQELFGSSPGLKPHLVKVRFAVDAGEYLAAIDGISTEPRARPTLLAAREAFVRLAITLGAWYQPAQPEATREILSWACAWVMRHTRTWLERCEVLGSEDGRPDAAQKVLEVIVARKGQGMPRSHLPMYCRPYKRITDREKRQKLVDMLIDDGDIVEIVPPGRQQKVLVAARFVTRKLKAVA